MNIQNDAIGSTLQLLVERLTQSYYYEIIALCSAVEQQSQKLREMEVQQAASQYVGLCLRLTKEITQCINNKKEHFVPYVHSLYEKDKAGHDCQSCTGTGNCSMQHDMHLMELDESNKRLKDILSTLQLAVLPLYTETIYPDAYRVLRNNMALLENSLAEMLFFEETQLIPKIKEAQKNINARGSGK